MIRRIFIACSVCGTLALMSLLVPAVRREIHARISRATVEDRLQEIEQRVRPLWAARLRDHPIEDVTRLSLVTLKAEREFHVVAHTPRGAAHLATYPILAASGSPGPKFREGDRQVPEGIYSITFLNPNSRYRLSMRLDYPNADDRAAARADGRDERLLGDDIMIHGGALSVGCIALGDPAIEEIFWLVAKVGIKNVEVVLAPTSAPAAAISSDMPNWLKARYELLTTKLSELGVSAPP